MRNNKEMVIIVSAGIVIIIGTLAYFGLTRKPKILKITEKSKISDKTNINQIQLPIEKVLNWKIYNNHDFSFEIKYPSNMFFTEDKLEDLKKDRLELYNSEEWYEIAPTTFFEKSARGEFADRLIIKVIRYPLTDGNRKFPYSSLNDYIEYRKQLLSSDGNLKNINFTKFSIGTVEAVEETYESKIPPLTGGLGKTVLVSLYRDGLIYTFVLGSDDPQLLDVYRAMVKTFTFTP